MLRRAGRIFVQSISSNVVPFSTETSKYIIDPKRAKGVSKKLFLRAVNRNIIPRIARRACIGIPVLGLFLVQRLFRNDIKQALDQSNPPDIRKMYMGVATADGIDLLAQTTMLTALSATLFFQDASLLQNIDLPEILKYADKTSLGAAFTSCTLGTYAELQKEKEK
jgi:hypothetical protein